MIYTPPTDRLAEYLLALYDTPGSHPEPIVAGLWRSDPFRLETILWDWFPHGALSGPIRRGAVPWFAAQFVAAVSGDRDEAYAHDLFTAFVSTNGLEHMQEAMRMLAEHTLRQRWAR